MHLLCDMRFEKGEKFCQKADSNPGRSRQNEYGKGFTICAIEPDYSPWS